MTGTGGVNSKLDLGILHITGSMFVALAVQALAGAALAVAQGCDLQAAGLGVSGEGGIVCALDFDQSPFKQALNYAIQESAAVISCANLQSTGSPAIAGQVCKELASPDPSGSDHDGVLSTIYYLDI